MRTAGIPLERNGSHGPVTVHGREYRKGALFKKKFKSRSSKHGQYIEEDVGETSTHILVWLRPALTTILEILVPFASLGIGVKGSRLLKYGFWPEDRGAHLNFLPPRHRRDAQQYRFCRMMLRGHRAKFVSRVSCHVLPRFEVRHLPPQLGWHLKRNKEYTAEGPIYMEPYFELIHSRT